MARIDEIYNDITAQEANNAALAALDTTGDTSAQFRADVANGSNVGRHRIVKYIIAQVMDSFQNLWEVFREQVNDLALDGHYGTARWYVAKALQYQYGHDLVFTPLDAVYDPVDTSARVVSQAAVEEAAYKVILKASRLVNGVPQPLTADQRVGLQDFINEIKPVGIRVVVRSAFPDGLRVYGQMVGDAKQGLAAIEAAGQAAITAYITNLDFNGVFSINQMRQRVLAVPGMIDFNVDAVASRLANGTSWVAITRVRRAYAGYMKIDSSYPLSSTVEMISADV